MPKLTAHENFGFYSIELIVLCWQVVFCVWMLQSRLRNMSCLCAQWGAIAFGGDRHSGSVRSRPVVSVPWNTHWCRDGEEDPWPRPQHEVCIMLSSKLNIFHLDYSNFNYLPCDAVW